MTATIKPPDKGPAERRRLRLSSMEILGFSDSSSTWSESTLPPVPGETRRGRHETTVADLQPEDFGGRLTGGNIRWGLVTTLVLLFAGLLGVGVWLSQRTGAEERASLTTLDSRATDLAAAIPTLEQASDQLLDAGPSQRAVDLLTLESAARGLFEASGDLGNTRTDFRSAASQASSSTLDGIRLATGARSYRSAVIPLLEAPALETDPEIIALDEAARQFGSWQLAFDDVRTALPDGVLSPVSEQLDILSGDLATILGRYVDALRQNDETEAERVLADLDDRLTTIEAQLDATLVEVQTRIDVRIAEANEALSRILGN
jgi:hypothetical protein